MKEGGLTKWFQRKMGRHWSKEKRWQVSKCGRKSASGSKRKYPKCVPLAKATAMTKSQRASAVARKRAVVILALKPTNV